MKKIEILYVVLFLSLVAGFVIGNELVKHDNRKFQPATAGEPIYLERHQPPATVKLKATI